ncbi:hypothetical protein GCM10020331_094610 [Ectobacillus funiculus]
MYRYNRKRTQGRLVFVCLIMLAISARKEENPKKTAGQLLYLAYGEVRDIRFAEGILILLESLA